ncbi:MAG: carbon-nitrogen hydrolase family protein [Romboutsia sp.]|uniref:carbon-nitrogen hydrolase family protein n=1 Tax=Romboutsia sp. TaxID=1965302 RepID=UPI003F3D8D2F
MKTLKVALIQLKVDKDKDTNVNRVINYIDTLINKNIDMVVLPEMFCCPYDTANFSTYAEYEGGTLFNKLSSIAKKYGIYLVSGSVPEIDSLGNIYNTSYVFDRNGLLIGKHRKVHLFDISISENKQFKESDAITPGNDFTVFDTEFGKIGLCICYDFRFPELSRLMVNSGAKAIIVPAAFNMTTGPVHWELMFKSRAVDNQVYTIGCAPSRDSSASYVSYANSLIVSPWGEVIKNLGENEGTCVCDLDFNYVDKIRNKLPLLKHRRDDLYTVSSLK